MWKGQEKTLKRILACAFLLAALLGLNGCGAGKPADGSDRVSITMHLWDKSMCKALTPWLEECFPEIDFTFVVGYNTMAYYTDLNERGALPDIITCRRFSLNDAAHMADLLMDLSKTEVVGTFYDSYIENNREPGGAIRWLPMCAEVDGYIANLDLFAQCGIPVPTNYAEFADACRRFTELGYIGYANDYREDYSCMEALQGCAIPELMTIEGTMWRARYESETKEEQIGLDDQVWPVVFERFEQYIRDTQLTAADADMDLGTVKPAFLEGRAAMMRGTASDCVNLNEGEGMNCVMLPYFGETAEDNWLLTYPSFQVAVSRAVETDSRKSDAVRRVLEAMFSEEGQRRAATSSAVLSYNKNVNNDMGEAFSYVTDCVSRNHLYMRLASTEMFSISRDVVQRMIRGEYGAQGAYEDFHAQLVASQDSSQTPAVVATQRTGYPYADGEGGSPAASAVLGTLRRQIGAQVAVGFSSVITAPVFEGDYTAQQLNWLIANRALMRRGELTGAELRELMQALIDVREDGSNPIRHKNLLPVTSGMAYTLKDCGGGAYALVDLTIDGKPLSDSAVYSVLMLGDNSFIEAPIYGNCPLPSAVKEKMEQMPERAGAELVAALEGGAQMEAPQAYLRMTR